MSTVLIVEQDPDLGRLWARHMERDGACVTIAQSQRAAKEALRAASYDALVVDLSLPEMSALAVAELASFLQPDARVVFVTPDDSFSGGAIFALSSNASAYLPTDTRPEDLAAIVEYHAAAR